MKRILASLVVLSMSLPGSVGCSERTSTTIETNPSTPERSTTIITEKEARKTGDTNVIIGTPSEQRDRPSADRQQGGSNDQRPAAPLYQPKAVPSAKEQPAAVDKTPRATGDKQPSTSQSPRTDESQTADKK